MPAIDKGWVVTAKICEKTLVYRTRAVASFRQFVGLLAPKYRAAGSVFFPDDWAGILNGSAIVWDGVTSEEAASLAVILGSIQGFVVWTSRRTH